MRNKRLALLATTALAALVLVAAGCEVIEIRISHFDTTAGKVLDARQTTDIGVGSVNLTLSGDETYTTLSLTNGDYSFGSVEPGEYRLTGTRSGWYIAPQDIVIGSGSNVLPQVNAFQLSQDDEWAISFIVSWTGDIDVDAHLSFPTESPAGIAEFTAAGTPYQDPLDGNRAQVYWPLDSRQYPAAPATAAVFMDRDDLQGPGVETITLRSIPHSEFGINADPNSTSNGMHVIDDWDDNVDYMGAAILYVNAYGSGAYLVDGAENARVTIYAIQTVPSNGGLSANVLGVYRLPEETQIKSASILRVNMFDDGIETFILVPDMGVIPDGTAGPGEAGSFLSVDSQSGIVGVRGRR